jgi:hypothetical protein
MSFSILDTGNSVLIFLNRTAGLTTFPDYLVLHMRKFVMEAGWVPKKLGIFILPYSSGIILVFFLAVL